MYQKMSVFELGQQLVFPSPVLADHDGLVAVGGDLRPERLLLAYSSGIFPWPTEDSLLLWHSPDPRYVLLAHRLHVPQSLQRRIKKNTYRVTLDSECRRVIHACASTPRLGQNGTWITGEMIDAYDHLHELGFAHSVEVWEGEDLVGGLYGVSLGGAFFGESMFAERDDASKVGFVLLVKQLARWGIDLIDAQVHTRHLERFGAEHWSRPRYLVALTNALGKPTRRGPWRFDSSPDIAVVSGSVQEGPD
jgi:leucyl/phenylalanyl-tRNA--protein transferase